MYEWKKPLVLTVNKDVGISLYDYETQDYCSITMSKETRKALLEYLTQKK